MKESKTAMRAVQGTKRAIGDYRQSGSEVVSVTGMEIHVSSREISAMTSRSVFPSSSTEAITSVSSATDTDTAAVSGVIL